ncbi:hypothetical protein F5888DRAFT_1635770 [Russula emetica]|nr:hypothetical protein F5888DRAFT_1635770 [Russula emetica]
MTLTMGVSATGGGDHVWLGDKDVLEGSGGWSAPDAQRMRYTGVDEEEDEDEPTRKIETLNNRTDQLGWPLTLFAPKYLTGTESGLQVWKVSPLEATPLVKGWIILSYRAVIFTSLISQSQVPKTHIAQIHAFTDSLFAQAIKSYLPARAHATIVMYNNILQRMKAVIVMATKCDTLAEKDDTRSASINPMWDILHARKNEVDETSISPL